jgi:hypothetical protein
MTEPLNSPAFTGRVIVGPELIAIPRETVADMMTKLERVTMLTSDEPQSLAQQVYMTLRQAMD